MENTYAFAGAVYDPERGELLRDGKLSRLRPQSGAVLAYLLDHPRQVVAKDELLREVWPNLVVTENSLAQCVREIRRELADEEGLLVRTAPRRGYILEADVARGAPAPAEARRPGPKPAKRLALVVTPLANVGGDPEQEYFADGLTDDLTTDLGQIPEALVVSRTTAYTYRGRALDLRAMGLEIGVRYVVAGSVRRRGDDVVVNLSLSETENATQIWAERFEGRRANLEALQRKMAGEVAQTLGVQLFEAEAERIERQPSPNPDAQDLAMRAWSLWNRVHAEGNVEARRLARQAVELDPGCIRGWITLAHALITDLVLRLTQDAERTLAEAEDAARRAATLDPRSPLVNTPLGITLAYRGRFEEALGVFDAQQRLNPNFPLTHAWTGITHILMGNPTLAVPCLERAIELSPRAPALSTFYRNIAVAQLHAGNDDQALSFAERSVRLPNPWARSYETLAAVYGAMGLIEDARAAVKVLLQRWPGYSIARHREEMISSRPAFLAQRERYIEGLRVAGLPES